MIKNYYQGAIHHIYSRGANKEPIFKDEQDYYYFLKRLRSYKEKYKISIICFILMPNHFYLETEQLDDLPLSKMMQYLLNGYTLYFNKKYNHSGCLFESKFKAILIYKDEYLLWLSAYIHTNSSIANIARKSENYKWSSYMDYLGLRNGTICDKEIILSQFEDSKSDSDSNKDSESLKDSESGEAKKGIERYKKFVEMASVEIKNKKDLEKYLID